MIYVSAVIGAIANVLIFGFSLKSFGVHYNSPNYGEFREGFLLTAAGLLGCLAGVGFYSLFV